MTPSKQTVYFVTHPHVLIDPAVPVPNERYRHAGALIRTRYDAALDRRPNVALLGLGPVGPGPARDVDAAASAAMAFGVPSLATAERP